MGRSMKWKARTTDQIGELIRGDNTEGYIRYLTGVLLSNSEMTTGVSSPTCDHFTQRISLGTIHPQALLERMAERELA